MATRIVVFDDDVTGDTIVTVQRLTLPQTIEGLANGEPTFVVNTSSSPQFIPASTSFSSLSLSQWYASEAVDPAYTRKTEAVVRIDPPAGKRWQIYSGPAPNGDLTRMFNMTQDPVDGFWKYRTSGSFAQNVEVFVRIAMENTDGSSPEWVVSVSEIQSFRVSTVPPSPSVTWTPAGVGAVDVAVAPDLTVLRPATLLQYSLDSGATWTDSASLLGFSLTGLTANTEVPVATRLQNANGFSGVTTLSVIAEAADPDLVPPGLTVRHEITDRTIVIYAESLTGTAPITVTLSALTLNGTSVVLDAQGTNPFYYSAVSSLTDQTVAYTVTATNAVDTASATGSYVFLADLTPPVDEPNPSAVVDLMTYTMVDTPDVSGVLRLNVTSVPANATELVARIVSVGNANLDVVIPGPAEVGLKTISVPHVAGRRVSIQGFARNSFGDGPRQPYGYTSHRVAGIPTLTCRVNPSDLRGGEKAIVSFETTGYPEPVLSNITATLGGVPVLLDGKGNVRSFVVPSGTAAGTVLEVSANLSNIHGAVGHTATKAVLAARSFGAPIAIADRAALDAALATAVGGEHYSLAAGSYGDLTWTRLHTSDPIRISSQTGRTAVFGEVSVSGSTIGSVQFDNVTMGYFGARSNVRNVWVMDCDINGLSQLGSAHGVVFTNNTLNDPSDPVALKFLILAYDLTGSIISGNTVLNSTEDQCRISGASADVILETNRIMRLDTIVAVNHADSVQIFGANGTSCPRRVAVRRNLVCARFGDQGIFISDSRSVEGFRDFTVHDNVTRSPGSNKITFNGMGGGSLYANNTSAYTLRVGSVYGGLVTQNLAQSIYKSAAASSYPAGTFVDNMLISSNYQSVIGADPGTVDLSVWENWIPNPAAGISDSYGATAYIKSLESVTPPTPVDIGVPVTFSEIRADGWTAVTSASTADWEPTTDESEQRFFIADQPGYDTEGEATTHRTRRVITKRLREPGVIPAVMVNVSAMTDYVIAGSTVFGGVCNSTRIAPKAWARWVSPDRRVVGNTITLEVLPFHRAAMNGQPVAAVRFRATDGTTTVTQTVGEMTISPKSNAAGLAVPVYRCVLDISTLADQSDITVNAEVLPWIGTSASICDSADVPIASADRYKLGVRMYRKSIVDADTPLIAVVKPSTGTSGGVVSRDPAVARATPFATITQALVWFKNNATNIDGAQIWIAESMSGTWQSGSSNKMPQRFAAVTITRDPSVERASAVLSATGGVSYIGRDTTLYNFPVGCIELKDITVASISTGVQYVGELDFDDVTLTGGLNLSTASQGRIYGLTHTGGVSLAGPCSILRGVDHPNLGNATNAFDPRCVVGSRLVNAGIMRTSAVLGVYTPQFYVSNMFLDWRVENNSLANYDAQVLVQNIVEVMAAGNTNVFALSSDGAFISTDHIIETHNTFVGPGPGQVRCNTRYDETPYVYRTHDNIMDMANIWMCLRASKGDAFILGKDDGLGGVVTPEEAALHTGNWQFTWGVNCGGNYVGYQTSFEHSFDGIGSVVGDVSAGLTPPGFANNASQGGSDLGNGDYSITTGAASPCYNVLPGRLILAYDIFGNVRSQTDAGAIRIVA